jgi:hypothetical protein
MQDRKGSDPGYLVPGNRNPIHFYPAYPVCGFFEDRCQVPNRRRGPDTEHRRPSLATEKRAHGVCILYPASLRHDSPGW